MEDRRLSAVIMSTSHLSEESSNDVAFPLIADPAADNVKCSDAARCVMIASLGLSEQVIDVSATGCKQSKSMKLNH